MHTCQSVTLAAEEEKPGTAEGLGRGSGFKNVMSRMWEEDIGPAQERGIKLTNI